MDQPLTLQRLCMINLGATTWQSLHLIHQIQEIFPFTHNLPKVEKAFMEDLSRKLVEGLAPRPLTANHQELESFFQKLMPDEEHVSQNLQRCSKCDTFFLSFGRIFQPDKHRYKKFQSIHPNARLYLRRITGNLPVKLQNPCEEILMEMGEKIYHWHEYINTNLQFNVKVPNKFYWTSNGSLDENKYLEQWEQDDEFLKQTIYSQPAPVLYILACVYVQKDFIKAHQNKMEQLIKIGLPNFKLENYEDKTYTLISLYLNFLIIKEESIGFNDLNNSGYVINPDKMLEMSIRASFHKLVYYFWGKLTDFGYDEQYLINITKDSMTILRKFNNDHSYYSREKAGEITNFLINQIPIENRKYFIQDNAAILYCGFLPLWPYKDISSEIINDHLSILTKSDCCDILMHTQWLSLCTTSNGGPEIRINNYREIFEEIYFGLSKDLKEDIFDKKFICETFRSSDLKCLKLVFNDMDERLRCQIISRVKLQTVDFVIQGNIEKIRLLIDVILISDEEKSNFKKYLLNHFNRFWGKEFKDFDEFFNFLSVTETKELKKLSYYRFSRKIDVERLRGCCVKRSSFFPT